MNHDTISKTDVVKIVKSVLSPASSLTNVARARRQMLDQIYELESKPEPHWISVTERLPEVKQRVIVQYADGSMAIKRCIDAGHLQWFYTKFGTVAWMPAPEPMRLENK